MNNQLSQAEADAMLVMLKHTLEKSFELPKQRESKTFKVQGIQTHFVFDISVFRGKINKNKLQLNALISLNNILLLSLHLNPTNRHINPDGELVNGSHWHIYKEGYGTSFAYPATDIKDDDFVHNTLLFLDRFNVISPPAITEQESLDL